uniref:Putative hu li tai shao n=1 Tax=Ixodes ricinus TaxID=34613 RepID=A0A0K8R7S3_IXORI
MTSVCSAGGSASAGKRRPGYWLRFCHSEAAFSSLRCFFFLRNEGVLSPFFFFFLSPSTSLTGELSLLLRDAADTSPLSPHRSFSSPFTSPCVASRDESERRTWPLAFESSSSSSDGRRGDWGRWGSTSRALIESGTSSSIGSPRCFFSTRRRYSSSPPSLMLSKGFLLYALLYTMAIVLEIPLNNALGGRTHQHHLIPRAAHHGVLHLLHLLPSDPLEQVRLGPGI